MNKYIENKVNTNKIKEKKMNKNFFNISSIKKNNCYLNETNKNKNIINNKNNSNNIFIYKSIQSNNKINVISNKNPKDDEFLNDIMDNINYKGPINNLPTFIKNLIEKAEISNLILKYFCGDGRDLYDGYKKAEDVVLNNYEREKYFENEIEIYQNLCDELLKRNQNKINNEELQNYFKEIYKVKNIIEKKY